MTKFKVGDKVKVVNLNFDMYLMRYASYEKLLKDRLHMLNKEYTIKEFFNGANRFNIVVEGEEYMLQEQNVELVEAKREISEYNINDYVYVYPNQDDKDWYVYGQISGIQHYSAGFRYFIVDDWYYDTQISTTILDNNDTTNE